MENEEFEDRIESKMVMIVPKLLSHEDRQKIISNLENSNSSELEERIKSVYLYKSYANYDCYEENLQIEFEKFKLADLLDIKNEFFTLPLFEMCWIREQ